jgi:hypothetical protein
MTNVKKVLFRRKKLFGVFIVLIRACPFSEFQLIQLHCRAQLSPKERKKKVVRRMRRLNPLCNTRTLLRLNPYAAVLKREAILSPQKRQMGRDELLAKKRKVSTYCN